LQNVREEGGSIDPIALTRKNCPDRYRNVAATTGVQRVAPAMFIEKCIRGNSGNGWERIRGAMLQKSTPCAIFRNTLRVHFSLFLSLSVR